MQFEFHFWQCDQIELFLIGIDNKISYKMSPNIFLGTFDNITLYNKNACGYTLGNFRRKLGYFFLTSGHTDFWFGQDSVWPCHAWVKRVEVWKSLIFRWFFVTKISFVTGDTIWKARINFKWMPIVKNVPGLVAGQPWSKKLSGFYNIWTPMHSF